MHRIRQRFRDQLVSGERDFGFCGGALALTGTGPVRIIHLRWVLRAIGCGEAD
jgi:hypothetical protein